MRPFYQDKELFAEEKSIISVLPPAMPISAINIDMKMSDYKFTIEKCYPLFEQISIYYNACVQKNLNYHKHINYDGK